MAVIVVSPLSCTKSDLVPEGIWSSDDGGYQFVINRNGNTHGSVYVLQSGRQLIFVSGDFTEVFKIIKQTPAQVILEKNNGDILTLKRR